MRSGELVERGRKSRWELEFKRDIIYVGVDNGNNQINKAGKKYCYLVLNIGLPYWIPALYFKWKFRGKK